MTSMFVYWLVFEAVVAILIMIAIDRKAHSAGFRKGSETGYASGFRTGWNARHEESTEEERESWRQRAAAEMRKVQERELAAYQSEMGAVGRGLELSSTPDSEVKN